MELKLHKDSINLKITRGNICLFLPYKRNPPKFPCSSSKLIGKKVPLTVISGVLVATLPLFIPESLQASTLVQVIPQGSSSHLRP